MAPTVRRYTVDELDAFPNDGNRYELVSGVLRVTPGPSRRHQLAVWHPPEIATPLVIELPDVFGS